MQQTTLTLSAVTAVIVIWIVQRKRRSEVLNKIPKPANSSWILGRILEVYSAQPWEFLRTMESYGPTSVYNGFFGAKVIHTFDPKALYHILVKDQGAYDEMGWFLQINKLLFGEGLLATEGEKHRRQKKLLNPAFASLHLREMVPIFNSVARTVDMFPWLSRAAFELFVQAGLGTSFDPLTDETSAHPYSAAMKDVLPYIARVIGAGGTLFLPFVEHFGTPEFRLKVVEMMPFKLFKDGLTYAYYMWDLSSEIFHGKKSKVVSGEEKGKDLLSVLIHANLNAATEDRLDEKEIIGQSPWYSIDNRTLIRVCFRTLTFAAMDTTSSALSRTFDLLARHPDVQERLRAEILKAQEDNGKEDLSYDDLVNLPYLEAVCKESLRLHPPVHAIPRIANRDCVLPLSTPIIGTDGSLITEVPISKGQEIYLSLIGSNRNPAIWGPDANEWKPERWLAPLPSSLVEAKIPGIYSNLMSFSAGSRSCIGFKFSHLEMKTVLGFLVGSFKFTPTGQEVVYHSAGVANPSVKGSDKPQLPLILRKVD
uniref:Cytochrome p450 n=1 Tax=Moniliophthora roreri TaxID=221103 RepID=A0A0W0FSC4_MONRR